MQKYKAEEYTYRVFWSEEDEAFIAVADEFKSLSNIADTQAGALAGMVDLLKDVLREMYRSKETPPALSVVKTAKARKAAGQILDWRKALGVK